MNSFKRCPFCGSSPFLMREEFEENGRKYFKFFVRCCNSNCAAYIPNGIFTTVDYSMEEAQQRALKIWDHRYKNNDLYGFNCFVSGALEAARQAIVDRYEEDIENDLL